MVSLVLSPIKEYNMFFNDLFAENAIEWFPEIIILVIYDKILIVKSYNNLYSIWSLLPPICSNSIHFKQKNLLNKEGKTKLR